MKIELTTDEREMLRDAFPMGDWSPRSLVPAVEDIAAARVGQALRDAADESKPISGYMGNHRWISSERLREIAAEYDDNRTDEREP